MSRFEMKAETLKELLANATPGAWKRGHIHEREFPNHTHLYSELGRRADGIMRIKTIAYFPKRGTPEQTTADADLIAVAPQLAADNIALQAEVERLREENDQLRGIVHIN